MPKRSVSSLIEDFVRSAEVQGEATREGDYRRGNKASRRLLALGRVMEKDQETAHQMLDVLLEHSNINVRIWAACKALDLNYRREDAVAALRDIAGMPKAGILGFNAEMCLKVRHIPIKTE